MHRGTDNPLILALDAAGSSCSVAVGAGDRVLGAEHRAIAHGQAEALLPMVDGALRRTGLPAAALALVAVTIGPGSFTGIRVGLAAAQGIALGLDLPLIGVTGFEAVAAICGPDSINCNCDLLVALESRRADLYVQIFDAAGRPLGAPAAVLPAALARFAEAAVGAGRTLTIAGDAAARAAAALGARPGTILVEDQEARALGALRAAMRRWRGGERGEVPVQPFYLRPPDATPAAARLAPPRIVSRRL